MEYIEKAVRQQPRAEATATFTKSLALFAFSLVVYYFALRWRVGLEVADDGAFFLRYAQNMLAGEFWVWNLGEAPVWGASAPFYPVFLAVAMGLGISPEHSILVVGYVLSATSLSLLTVMLARQFGLYIGVAFLTFTALNTGLMYFGIGGLESPATYAVLCFAIWAILRSDNWLMLGAAAGLLMINKLDLLPIGCLLLLSLWVRDRRFPTKAIVVALAIATIWYVFAWVYFGAPVPNSFLTKSLHQDNLPKIIDWTWFTKFVYLSGAHRWLALLAIAGVILNFKKNLPLLILLVGTLAVHTIAYTIKYPFEPYNWYCMPSVLSLAVLACIGIFNLLELATKSLIMRSIVTLAFLGVFAYLNYPMEVMGTNSIKQFAGLHELDRANAGRWVEKNTPKDFKVLTYWGNPAFYSNREVIDGSFLNRKYEKDDLISKYRPEIIILQANPDTNPMQPRYWVTERGYTVVKIFDETFKHGMAYFFGVMVRNDLLDKVTNIDPPKDYLSLFSNITLGDKFGAMNVNNQSTLFIHPGATTPTEATLDTAAFRTKFNTSTLSVNLRISPLISQEAIDRGAGNVRVIIMDGAKTLLDTEVKPGSPAEKQIDISHIDQIHIAVDNNGGADTDWLLLSIH